MKSLAAWLLATLLFCSSAFALEFHVSPTGRAENSGAAASPFATLAQARDAVRIARQNGLPAGGITVWIHSGIYDLPATLQFDAADSGTADSPIVYAAVSGEQVRLTGARSLDPAKWTPVDERSRIWSRLDASARGNVFVTTLAEHGVHDFGSLKPRGFVIHASAPLELFAGGLPMTLGRWPNAGESLARTQSSSGDKQFTLTSNRIERWTGAPDVWMHGLWSQSWADFHVAVARIDAASKTVSFASGPAQFGLGSNRPFYAYNLLEEIDQPGEYYVDRATGLLYLWPRETIGSQPLQVSMLEEPILRIAGARHLVFRGLTIEAARGSLVRIDSGTNNRFERCLFRNAGQAAAHLNGTDNGLDHCEIVDCGEEGVFIEGGQRTSLTPGKNYVTHSRIHRTGRLSWTYKPGISIENGAGNIAAHNLLDDMPHTAILFGGNNQLIESNEISRVCQQTSDTGAIYSGRGWGARGNIVRFNYIHHIETSTDGDGAHGIYLDDGMSGVEVYGNVLYRIANTGIFCGGGRDNIIRNNLIARCGVGHFNDDRVRFRITNSGDGSWNFLGRLSDEGIRYQSEPWASAYPALAAIPNSWDAIQQGLWRNPQGTVFSTNAGWDNNAWLFEYNDSRTGVFSIYAALDNNRADQPALFDEHASEDRNARPEQLVADLRGFTPIPFRAIGPSSANTNPVTRPPATPSLGGQAVSDSLIALQWSDNGNGENQETGFSLERRAGNNAAWTAAGNFGPDVNVATISGLTPATSYEFRVRAFNSLGAQFSNVLTLVTLPAGAVYGPAVRVEAENPLTVANDTGANGSVGVSDAALDSGQSVRLYDAGDAVHVSLVAPTAGQYRIGARVRTGGSTGPASFWPDGYRFKLDGQDIVLTGDRASLSALDDAYGGCYWGTMWSATLTLGAGAHTLEIAAASSWAVADYAEIAPLGGENPPPQPPSPPPPPVSTSATVTVPGTLTVEATSVAGANVTFTTSARDSLGNSLTTRNSHSSGATFPLGTTTVTTTAADAAGHTDTKTFSIVVRDTTSPAITAPADFSVSATSAFGANVSFSASAYDLVNGARAVTSSRAAGSFFLLGTTFVTVTATDDAHNTASKTFSVTVSLNALAAPTGLTAAGWNASIDLDWQPVLLATSYTVRRATSANGPYAIIATGLTSPEFTDNAVSNGTAYFYTVSANNNLLTSADSSRASATPIASTGFDAWTSSDIGNVAHAGRASFANGTFTVSGSGADIWEGVVAFQYVYQPLAGDGSITARITSVQNTDSWAKAGLMIREGLDPGAPYAGLYLTPGNGAAFQWRTRNWAACSHLATAAAAPTWLRLTRAGNELTAFVSANGATWNRLGSATLSLSGPVYIGLAVTAHNHHALTTATFTDVTLPSGPSSPPPPPPTVDPTPNPNPPTPPPIPPTLPPGPTPVGSWSSQDIGAPALAGSSTQQNGTLTVRAAGSDIWGSSDQFHYVALPAHGQSSIVARVTSLQTHESWSKAGVMIRESLAPNSAFAGLYFTGSNGMNLQWRRATGHECSHTYAGTASANWVSLTRNGPTITAQVSTDGVNWRLVDVITVPMADSVYIGLATTSHHAWQLATATFNNLTATP